MKFRFGSSKGSGTNRPENMFDSYGGSNTVSGNAGSAVVRKAIIFHGTVQGVGFRWRARQAAEILGLTGWVHNEYDGTVSMEVQGSEEAISRMIGLIDEGSFIHIDDMEVTRLAIHEGESGFRIDGYGY